MNAFKDVMGMLSAVCVAFLIFMPLISVALKLTEKFIDYLEAVL